MINGYQPRSIFVIKTPDMESPRAAEKISEPLLAFAADFVMQQLVTQPRRQHDRRWAGYTVRNEDIINRCIIFFSDVSIDSRNALYFRRGDPRHGRFTRPRDHLVSWNI
ncbi:Hypothetical protein, putative [Bodo saltans]|uniref:Uncharacterized protein n=1 Tax=Bodo saltans TaxID=75058 RepID=A0A0S4IQ34_BODSA|nr:Hypothetical protein, putative [Bodo saltans]|eukprot:CUF09876.1 Hypothetical protein, putative [Bodo saltans]